MGLKRDFRDYFYKYCRMGHMLYSSQGPVTEKRCTRCGSEFLDFCPNCNSPIPARFSSPSYFTSGQPVHQPNRPDFCRECGESFPWYELQQKLEDQTLDSTNVFVVHGRNLPARDSMFQFLRSVGLKPIEWSQATIMAKKGAPFVGEILDAAYSNAQAVVVLLTGDDEAKLKKEFLTNDDPMHEKELSPQARPNVLFEAGMAFGVHPDRTVLVELGQIRPFSDIAGRHVIKMNNSTEMRQELAKRLQTAGCAVDLSGTDWHKAGDFQNCVGPSITPLAPEMKFRSPFYYISGDSIPFCPICWESDKRQIHLDGPHNIPDEKPFYRCLKCNNNF